MPAFGKRDILFLEMKISINSKKIFKFLDDYFTREERAPSIREIAEASKVSSKTVLHCLAELEAGGYIRRSPYRSRTIQIISRDEALPEKDVSMVPLVGLTAGGPTILAEQNIDEYVPVSTKLIGTSKDTFLLKVKGSSMTPYLDNGDIALVSPQKNAERGEIVVASIENEFTHEFESTIKEYYPTDSRVILRPINKEFEPILVDSKNLYIQGVVKGVIKYSGN